MTRVRLFHSRPPYPKISREQSLLAMTREALGQVLKESLVSLLSVKEESHSSSALFGIISIPTIFVQSLK